MEICLIFLPALRFFLLQEMQSMARVFASHARNRADYADIIIVATFATICIRVSNGGGLIASCSYACTPCRKA